MARKIIHQDDVYTAANEIMATGDKPTVIKVYEALGRVGSYTTIGKYLKLWEEERASKSVELEQVVDIPDRLSQECETLIQELWKTARSLAAQALEGERTTLGEQEAELRTEMRQLLDMADRHVERIDELEDELRDNLEELQRERAASQKLHEESQELQQNLALKSAALERAITDVDKLEAKLEALTEKYEGKAAEANDLSKQIALAQAQNDRLAGELEQAKADIWVAREALSTAESALGEQKNQNATLVERINHLKGTNSELATKLESQQTKAAALAELNGKLTGQLDEKESKIRSLEEQLQALLAAASDKRSKS